MKTEKTTPDIAFWFDKKQPDRYILKIKDGTSLTSLVMAYFDLLSKAIQLDMESKPLMEWRDKDEEK